MIVCILGPSHPSSLPEEGENSVARLRSTHSCGVGSRDFFKNTRCELLALPLLKRNAANSVAGTPTGETIRGGAREREQASRAQPRLATVVWSVRRNTYGAGQPGAVPAGLGPVHADGHSAEVRVLQVQLRFHHDWPYMQYGRNGAARWRARRRSGAAAVAAAYSILALGYPGAAPPGLSTSMLALNLILSSL
eukprot:4485855-Pleurochrysis_carterae.AAC.2